MPNNQQTNSKQGNTDGTGGGAGQKPQTLLWSQAGPKVDTPKKTPVVAPGSPMKPPSKLALVFVTGLILGCFLTLSWFSLYPPSSPPSGNNGGARTVTGGQTPSSTGASSSAAGQNSSGVTMPTSQVSASDSIGVPSPQSAGTTVAVSQIRADTPVWAVVYEDTNGTLGNVLGAARFTSERPSGTIELLRSTLPNLTYHVGLVADTPDHSFAVRVNAPIVDENGDRILADFVAQ